MQQAKSASFEALPAGPYDAECISADAVTSSTGKPMIKCKFEVISGPHAKRKFFNQFVLSIENETALAMFFRHMRAFGMDENFFAAVGQQGLAPVAQAMVGRRARFDLGIRKWNDEDRNEVKSVKPLAGGVASGGLPGTGAPALPGLPGTPGLPTGGPVAQPAMNGPVSSPPPPPVQQPIAPAPTPPQQVAPASPVQNGADPAQAAVAQPVPPPPVAVAEPAPPVQPVETPAPVQAPVQQPAPVAPVQQSEPQPAPPAEQQAVPVGAPAVAPPPPMPF